MTFNPQILGDQFTQSIIDSTSLSALDEEQKPANYEQAYAIQDYVFNQLNRKSSGWKVGLGNKAGMNAFNLPSPAAARMYSDSLYEVGETIAFDPFSKMVVEFEIIYKIKNRISPTTKIENPFDFVESTHLGFELIQPHINDWKTHGAYPFVAEGIGFSALVIDPEPMKISQAELLNSIEIYCDNEVQAKAATGDNGVDPEEMLQFLISHCQDNGHTIQAGDLISSGTQTEQFAVTIEDHKIEAKWNGGATHFTMTAK